jgi:butyrate kinase
MQPAFSPKRFLTINPGSTSTKLATFLVADDALQPEFQETIRHSVEELAPYPDLPEQFAFRQRVLIAWLAQKNLSIREIDIFVGRGGLIKPIPSGVYRVGTLMLEHLQQQIGGAHPCNLGGLLAHGLAREAGSDQAYIVDPAIVDEMVPEARLSGMPELPRISLVHTLNQKAVGHAFAHSIGKKYLDLNLVIVHMGGGFSIAAHQRGRMIDVNNGLDGEGAFTPERTGGLPTGALVNLCYSGEFTRAEMQRKIRGNGGLVAYLGSNDADVVEKRVIAGDPEAGLVYRAMAWQVAKDIGAYAAVLSFDVDAVILTGGLARSDLFCQWIEEKVARIARIVRYPGGDEEMALANGVFSGLRGERPVFDYVPREEK